MSARPEILVPAARPVACEARVIANRAAVPGGAILALEVGAGFPAPRAGQFVHVRIGAGAPPLLRRPFSVLGFSPSPSGGATIELMYAVVGQGTALLARVEPGERLGILGPLGNSFALGEARALLLVAGGRGAVPLYRLVESGDAGGRRAVFLFGARSADYLWGLERLPAGAGVERRLATIDGSAGARGTVIDLLAAALEELPPAERGAGPRAARVLACGPEVMLRRVAATAAAFGVESQVALENRMGCALGVCRGCVIPRRLTPASPWARDGNARYATVCKEGPVFLGEEVDWEAMASAEATVARGEATL